MGELFYLQDSRSVVGNAVLWWAENGMGYTCDLRLAHVYTAAELINLRTTDAPWPKEFVDKHQMPILDVQKKPLLLSWQAKNNIKP